MEDDNPRCPVFAGNRCRRELHRLLLCAVIPLCVCLSGRFELGTSGGWYFHRECNLGINTIDKVIAFRYNMVKMRGKNVSSIFIRLEGKHKDALEKEAGKLGMTLTTYCRMKLLESLASQKT